MASSASSLLSARRERNARAKHAQIWTFDAQKWASILRDRHPDKTAECVAAAIDEPAATVRKWLEGRARPGWRATLKLVGVYGPELLAAAMDSPPEWLDDAVRAERLTALRLQYVRLSHLLTGVDEPCLQHCAGSASSGMPGSERSGTASPPMPSRGPATTR
jgi:hypothetical protein